MSSLADLPRTVQMELNDLFVGDLIGAGTYREVYAHALDPSLVVKVELRPRGFSNVAEWEVWQESEGYPDIRRWLAPCVAISFSGSVLVQRRTQPITRLPKELPDFLCDIKRSNFGRIGRQVVAHDYGNHPHYTRSFRRWRMRPVSADDMVRI